MKFAPLVSYPIDPHLYFKYLAASHLFKCAVVCRCWQGSSWDALGYLLRDISIVGSTDPQRMRSLLERCTRLQSLDVSRLLPEESDGLLRTISTLPFRTSLNTLRTPAVRAAEILEAIADACPRLACLSIPGSTVSAPPSNRARASLLPAM